MDAHAVMDEWHDRAGAYSPGYYAYYGPDDASDVVRDALESTLARNAAVLELGCSSGRHLAHLYAAGYRDLTGIEINADAGDVMAETYPDLADAGTFHFDAIENVVTDFRDGRFDAVFSVETLQHIHPDHAWVFEEVARVTDDVLVTVENEGPDEPGREAGASVSMVDGAFPIYHRKWAAVFTGLGFVQVDSRSIRRDTGRVFRVDASG